MSKKTREPASLSATGLNPCIPRVNEPRTERTLSCRHDCGVEGEKFQKWRRIEERNKVDMVERWRREKSALWGSPALAVQEASIAGTPTMLGPQDLYRSCIGVSANIYLGTKHYSIFISLFVSIFFFSLQQFGRNLEFKRSLNFLFIGLFVSIFLILGFLLGEIGIDFDCDLEWDQSV